MDFLFKRKKVLFFLPKGLGGAQKITINISKMLPRDQFEIKYVVIGKRHEPDMCDLIDNGSDIDYINIFNAWDFLTLRIITVLRKEKPDIVFSSLMYINIRVILAAKFLGGIKVIIRNDNMLKIQRKDSIFLLNLTYKKADVIIAQQEEMRNELINVLNLDKSKVVVRHNPIDKARIISDASKKSPYDDPNTIKYIWTGNFTPSGSKGQDILVKAFEIVRRDVPNAHLYILGSFDYTENYYKGVKSFIDDHCLVNYVHCVGFKNNPYPWIKNADCFVLPSRIEGLPNSLIDAMVLSKPVVSTTCIPMISRMIKNGYNGFLVPTNDYVAMADAMIKALKLKNFEMIYSPSTDVEFIELF